MQTELYGVLCLERPEAITDTSGISGADHCQVAVFSGDGRLEF